MKNKAILLLFLLSFLSVKFPVMLRGQTDCGKALITAENLYQSGQLYDVSEALLGCLENGFNYQEKQSAYRLLTLTYLNINQEEKAKETLLKLLKLNPDYAISKEKDPVELYNLYEQFNVNPVFYVGLKGGALISKPYVLHHRSASSLEGIDKKYRPFYGYSVGADFVVPLLKNFLLEFSPTYAGSKYLFESLYLTDGFTHGPEPQVQEVTGSESYHQVFLPLTFNYRIRSRNSRLYYTIGAGAGASFLLASAYKNVNRVNRQIFTEEINVSRIETTPFRRGTNLQAHLELGLEYKYLGYFWGARTGLSGPVFNHTRYRTQQEQYLNTMSTTFGWLDDDFVLTNGHFTLFVRKPLYKFL